MVEPVRLVSLAAVMFGISLVPGPAAAYCVAAGLGVRRGFSVAAAVGVTLGKLVHLVIATLGALWLARLHGGVRAALLLTTAAFMLVQGWRRWKRDEAFDRAGTQWAASSRTLQGFAIAALNPQSLASAVAVIPIFLPAEPSSFDAATMMAVSAIAVFAAYMLYEVVAVLAARRLSTRARVRVMGATYMVAAAGVAVIAIA